MASYPENVSAATGPLIYHLSQGLDLSGIQPDEPTVSTAQLTAIYSDPNVFLQRARHFLFYLEQAGADSGVGHHARSALKLVDMLAPDDISLARTLFMSYARRHSFFYADYIPTENPWCELLDSTRRHGFSFEEFARLSTFVASRGIHDTAGLPDKTKLTIEEARVMKRLLTLTRPEAGASALASMALGRVMHLIHPSFREHALHEGNGFLFLSAKYVNRQPVNAERGLFGLLHNGYQDLNRVKAERAARGGPTGNSDWEKNQYVWEMPVRQTKGWFFLESPDRVAEAISAFGHRTNLRHSENHVLHLHFPGGMTEWQSVQATLINPDLWKQAHIHMETTTVHLTLLSPLNSTEGHATISPEQTISADRPQRESTLILINGKKPRSGPGVRQRPPSLDRGTNALWRSPAPNLALQRPLEKIPATHPLSVR